MQTFLPYVNFNATASTLDYKRLGKQRVEALQIHNIVSGKRTTGGWINHPAVQMWMGYEDALAEYHNAMIEEWVDRGYKNTMKLLPHDGDLSTCNDLWHIKFYTDKYKNRRWYPEWLSDERIIESHRSNLLRKDYAFYSKYNWDVPDNLPYVWGTNEMLDFKK